MRAENQIHVCMATIPRRINSLEKTVESLIDQVEVLKIHLNDFNHVPDFLKNPKIELVFGNNSKMSCTKFLWVDRLKGYYLTVDDDLIYPPDYVSEMTAAIDRERCIITAHGSKIKEGHIDSYYGNRTVFEATLGVPQDVEVDVPGTGVMGFHTEDVDIFFRDLLYPGMEDIALFKLAKERGYRCVVLAHDHGWFTPSTHKNDCGLWGFARFDDSRETQIINETRQQHE